MFRWVRKIRAQSSAPRTDPFSLHRNAETPGRRHPNTSSVQPPAFSTAINPKQIPCSHGLELKHVFVGPRPNINVPKSIPYQANTQSTPLCPQMLKYLVRHADNSTESTRNLLETHLFVKSATNRSQLKYLRNPKICQAILLQLRNIMSSPIDPFHQKLILFWMAFWESYSALGRRFQVCLRLFFC